MKLLDIGDALPRDAHPLSDVARPEAPADSLRGEVPTGSDGI